MELLPPLPHSMGISQPEQKASYSLAREARKQEETRMKPSKFLENEQSVADWRKDAAI